MKKGDNKYGEDLKRRASGKKRQKTAYKLGSFFFKRFPYLLHRPIFASRPSIVKIGAITKYRHTDWGLILIAGAVGVAIGFFVVLFHWSMEWAEKLFREMYFETKTLVRWEIVAFPLIPAFGGLLIGLLRKAFFRGATVEGLDSLIEALMRHNGKMDWRNSIKAILFAALLIGSGGGAGREGPTIALGASVGSTLAQAFRLKEQHFRLLCGSGAAAAISAIFNAPLGGIMFALEAIIGGVSIKAFAPLVVSSVMATATARFILGNNALLLAPHILSVSLYDYVLLAIAGATSGFIAIYYLKAYHKTASWVKKALGRFPEVARPAVGGYLAGAILLFLPTMLETTYSPINYVIAGNAAPLLQDSIIKEAATSLTGNNAFILTLALATLTFLIKPISNAISLESSRAGGTMAPVIKAGAMYGFLFGALAQIVYPEASPGLYAIVGAGATLAGAFQAPLAGAIILFEICRNYNLLLPLIFSSVFASFIAQKSGVRTFNPLQKEFVDDEEILHPHLKKDISI